MNRSSLFAAVLVVAIVSPGCKKDPGQIEVTPAADLSGASSAAPAPAPAKEAAPKDASVKFTKKPLAVGTKRTEDAKIETSLKLTLAKKAMEMQDSEASKKDEEILEVSDGKVTKLKVTFVEDQKSMVEGGKPAKAKTSAIAGKTYVLVAKDGKTTVLNDKEKPAPAAEGKLVQKQYESFGQPDHVTAALPDRALKAGDSVPELADGIAKEMKAHAGDTSGETKIDVQDVKVVFTGKDGDTGVFEVAMTMKVGAGPFKMSAPLKGKVSLRVADGWPAIMTLEGPLNLDLTEKDKAQGVEGGGTMKISSTYTYK